MSSEPEHSLSVEERRRLYGTVVGKKPFAVGPPPEISASYELHFTGEHLDRLREGIRDFGIFPDDEFFLGAVMAAIDKREAELGGEKVVNPERRAQDRGSAGAAGAMAAGTQGAPARRRGSIGRLIMTG